MIGLSPWVSRVEESVIVKKDVLALDALMDQVELSLRETVSLSVADCTALLAALHVLGQGLVEKVLREGSMDGLSERAMRATPSGDDADQGSLAAIARCEHLADVLRGVRRRLVAVELSRLDAAASQIAPFMRSVVWPLLWRAWLPALWHEGGQKGIGRDRIWQESDRKPEDLAHDALFRARRQSSLAGVLEALRYPSVQGQALATAEYIATAESARLACDPSRHPVAVSVAFAPVESRWRVGHTLTTIVVPHDIDETADLTRDSLVPAIEAVTGFTGGAVLDPRRTWQLAVGDYPGGAQIPNSPNRLTQITGPSAGAALGAALLSRACGEDLLPGGYVTAELASNGQLRPLLGGLSGVTDSDLQAKGRVLALTAAVTGRPPPRVVVASEEDGALLRAGAGGLPLTVAQASCLCRATDLVSAGFYSRSLVRQSLQTIAPPDAAPTHGGAGSSMDPANLVIRRLIDHQHIERWLFLSPVSAARSGDLAHAVSTGLARQALQPEFGGPVPVLLSVRSLQQASPPVRGEPRPLAELVVDVLFPGVSPVRRRAQQARIEHHLRDGTVLVILASPVDQCLGGTSAKGILAESIVKRVIERVVWQARRIVIVASVDSQRPCRLAGDLVTTLEFHMERVVTLEPAELSGLETARQ